MSSEKERTCSVEGKEVLGGATCVRAMLDKRGGEVGADKHTV